MVTYILAWIVARESCNLLEAMSSERFPSAEKKERPCCKMLTASKYEGSARKTKNQRTN